MGFSNSCFLVMSRMRGSSVEEDSGQEHREAPIERTLRENNDMVRLAQEKVEQAVEKKRKAELKLKRKREKEEKKERIRVRAEKKKRMEDALAQKMALQVGKKRKLPVTPSPAGEMTQKLKAKQKTTMDMYFSSSRNKDNGASPLAWVSDQPTPSDPIPLSSGSAVEDLLHMASSGPSQVTISVSPDTSNPGSSSSDVEGGTMDMFNARSPQQCEPDVNFSSLRELSDSDDESGDDGPPPPKKRKNYDCTRKFQMVWAAKLPWAEGILAPDGVLHMVKCVPCSEFSKKPCILAPKWDTLVKHEGRRTAEKDMPKYGVKKGEFYIAKDCRHRKNMRLALSKQPATVLQQVVNTTNRLERDKKKVQFATLFQILHNGRPLVEFESRFELYDFLQMPNNPRKHWSDNGGWDMAECMYAQVRKAIQQAVSSANFIALTADEVTTNDNGNWISIHVYVVKNFVRIPYLLSLQKIVDGTGSDNLTSLLLKALETEGGLVGDDVSSKLLCFGADGVAAFHGVHKGVTRQMQLGVAPFLIGVHCHAHRLQLAVKTLSDMLCMQSIEKVLAKTYNYFAHSPKRHHEFVKLAEVMETKGVRLLKNVKTRWVSMIEPLRRLLAQYRLVMAKMIEDIDDNKDAKVSLIAILIFFLEVLLLVYCCCWLFTAAYFMLKDGTVCWF